MSESLEAFCRGALNEPGWGVGHWVGLVFCSMTVYAMFAGIAYQSLRSASVDSDSSGVGAIFWPFVLPWMIGQSIAKKIATRLVVSCIPRAEVRK